MCPPSWSSLPPATPSQPSRLSQSTRLGSLCHTANSHWRSVLSMVMYMFQYHSLKLQAITSVQFSRSVVSNSLRPHGLQHTRLPCPSPTPGACSNSCPLSRWCHPTILFPVVPFSSCLQSVLASESFQMSQFFASGGQSFGVSASAPVLPMNILDWFPLGLTGLISLLSKELSRVFSNTTVQKHQFFSAQLSLWSNSHIHTWLLETRALNRWTFVGKVISLLFNMLCRLVITFLPSSKHLLISWLWSYSHRLQWFWSPPK